MSEISTKITVIDGMTGALNAMYRGVSQLLSGMEQMQRESKNAMDISAFQEAQKSMAESVAQMKLMEDEAKKVKEANKQITESAKNIQQAYKWQGFNSMEVFNTSGIERYKSEIKSLNDFIQKIISNQKAMGSTIEGMTIGVNPQIDGGFGDIYNLNNRIANLHNSVNSVTSIDTTGYTSANQARINAEIETLRAYEREILNVQASLRQNMSDGNMAGINSDVAKLNNLSEQLESRIRGVLSTVQAIGNVSWDNFNNVEIFNSTGLERAEQEINSLRNAYGNIESAQNTITNNALAMKLLPSNAASDINNINTRISNLSNVISNMETKRNNLNKWDTAGINRYNSEIENMRIVMNRIEGIQRDINKAVKDNDISRVNAGYSRLNSIVNSVESSIRDNTVEQNRFNSSLAKGSNEASRMVNNLTSGIKSYITMAATAFGGRQLISASDTAIGNNARLGLITDSEAEQKALQQQIYNSSKNSRGVYSDTVDSVAKLGLLAGDAFNNNSEIIKFSELMQKSFALSGASTQEKQSAMYQLTQAMAAGKLQGDEFRSIMENASMLAQAIADFTGKSKGEIKEMSSEGTITADIIKGAL
ncbi:MAG: tape measure protein, partial [Lachnospirales bacterium]